jgi:putative tricarboxylic transport membrane protein
LEILQNLSLGFAVVLSVKNLFYCLLGTIVGTAVGVLPGLGPIATIALLLPITFGIDSTGALIMLAGIYYGAQYGGSTTSILLNIPGETSAVVTTLDGYQMAKQGRAREALLVAALGSFFAGTVATFFIVGFATPLTNLALKFGATEYFAVMVLGLIAAVVLSRGSVIKAIGMVFLGILVGLVGTDITSSSQRFTFGVAELYDGIDITALALGLFGVAEIISNLERPETKRETINTGSRMGLGSWWLTREDFRRAWPASVRGTLLGTFLGIRPGGGAALASFSSYAFEKKISRNPNRFGYGAIEGVAGPESANNAGAQTSFIPMLTLGLPSNAVMALMIGALTIHNIQPGPQVMESNPGLYWGLIVSMWIGNGFLLILNLPLIGIWIKLLSVKYRLLYPAILAVCCIGVYSVSNSTFAVYLTAVFAILGYVFTKLECEPAPMILGFVLGPMMEEYFRRAMTLSFGNPLIFVQRPLSLGLLVVAGILLCLTTISTFSKRREEAFREG